MAKDFSVIELGVQAIIDTTEGNFRAENAQSLVGQTFGSETDPLWQATAEVSAVGHVGRVFDQRSETDQFSVGGGAAQTFDAAATYRATITYTDGTTATLHSAVIFQDTDGNTYLAPELWNNSDQRKLEAKPIESLELNSLKSSYSSGLFANRNDADFMRDAGVIEGTLFVDSDGDATQRKGHDLEDGLAGQVVIARDASGVEIARTTTDANGSYSFELPSGAYTIEVPTEINTGGLVAKDVGDHRYDSDADQITGQSGLITVTAGGTVSDIDFGFEPDRRDGMVDGAFGSEVMTLGYSDTERDLITDGDDVIIGDSGSGTPERGVFSWEQVSGHQIDSSFVQDVGGINVTYTRTADLGRHYSAKDNRTKLNIDGIETGEIEIDRDGALKSVTNGTSGQGRFEWAFDAPVSNVAFNVNDIDGGGIVVIRAYDANGALIDVDLTGGSKLDLTDSDGDGSLDQAASQGGFGATSSDQFNLEVRIDGPVSRIELEHTQQGTQNSGIWITDIALDAGVAVAPGNDTIDGADGDDLIYGDTGLITPERAIFSWEQVSGRQIDTSVTQTSQGIDVTYTRTVDAGRHDSSKDRRSDLNYDGIDTGDIAIDADGSLESTTNGASGRGVFEWSFSELVSNVAFNINDIDGSGVVRVRAFDESGAEIDVDLTGGTGLTLVDADGNGAADTAQSNGGYGATASADYMLQVRIDGPVARIELEHTQDGQQNSGIWVTDILFDAGVARVDEAQGGDDLITGGAGDDTIFGQGGDDTADGNTGSDTLSLGDGADVATYVAAENAGARDVYDGGNDIDTLRLELTNAEWFDPAVQADIAGFLAQAAADSSVPFAFTAFDLTAVNFEDLVVTVDGVPIDPADDPVTLGDDTNTLDENGTASGNVLINDVVPDLIASVDLVSDVSRGALSFNPDGSYVFDPLGDFDFLAIGESITETFQYSVTDANGDTGTATVTFTITGSNDAVTVTAQDVNGALTEGALLTETGSITYADLDASDRPTATQTALSIAAITGSGTPLALTAAQQALFEDAFAIAAPASNTNTGSINWTYALAEASIDFLNAGEIVTASFEITVTDAAGANASEIVSVTITGTNDAPTLAAASANATEDGPSIDVDLAALGADVDSEDDGTTLSYAITAQPAEGSAAIMGTTLTFAPGADFQDLSLGETRDVTIEVAAADAQGSMASNVVTVTVTGTNDAPTLAAASANATEDGPSIDVDLAALGADVDSEDDGTTLSYAITAQPAEGSAAIMGTTLTFAPGADFQDLSLGETRDVTIEVAAADAKGAMASNVVTVTVTGTNDAPTLAAASANATEDGPSIDVDLAALGADVDSEDDGSSLIYTVTMQPNEGSATITGTTLTFAPGRDFQDLAQGETRDVTIEVTATDAQGATATNVVTVTVTGTNDGPVALADVATALEDGALVAGSVASNDSDADAGAVLSYALDVPVAGLVLASDGSYTFDPSDAAYQSLAEGQALDIVVGYTVTDDQGASAGAALTITITGTNDAPMVTSTQADAQGSVTHAIASSAPNPTTSRQLTATDIDATDVLSWQGDANGLYGAFDINETTGAWEYQLDNANPAVAALSAGQTLTETFSVTVSDGFGGQDTQTVTITINGSNEAPVAADDDNANDAVIEEGAVIAGDASATGDVLANDTDINAADSLTVSGVASGTGAPDAGNLGAPITGNYGALTLGSDGIWTYALDNANPATDGLAPGEVVQDVFTYQVSDGQGGFDTASLSITITGSEDNRPPVARDDSASLDENGTLDGSGATPGAAVFNLFDDNGAGPDSDPDGDVFTVSLAGGQAPGTVLSVAATSANADVNGRAALVTVSANGDVLLETSDTVNFSGPDAARFDPLAVGETATVSFDYTIIDPLGETSTATATFTIVGSNDGPIALNDSASATEDGAPVIGSVALNDSDVDSGATLTYALDMPVAGLTLNADGSYAFDPSDAAYQGLGAGEPFTVLAAYTVTDDQGATDTATLEISLTGTNDAPIAQAANGAANEDGPGILIEPVVADPDVGDDVSITLDTSGTQGVVTNNGDGTFSYDPSGAFEALAAGETATDSFTYTADDGNGGTASNTVTLTITGQNDAPVAVAIAGAVNENGPLADAFTSVIADSATVPNAGRFFVLNYTDQSFTEVARIPGTIDTAEQAAAAISVTDGAVLNLNGNNADWGAQFVLLSGGVGTEADPNLFDLQGYSGASSINTTFSAAIYSNSVSNALLTITVPSADTPDGPTSYSLTAEIVAFTDNSVGNIDVGAVTITSNPIASSDSVTVTANFTDVDAADTHTFTVDTTGTQGLVTNNGDGTFDYDTNFAFEALAAGETTTDSFTYTVGDGNGGTSTETATITITGQNDAPIVSAPVDLGTSNEDVVFTFTAADLLANASDVDASDVLTVTNVTASSGTLTGDAASGFTFIPDANDNSGVTFSFDVTDGTSSVSTNATLDLIAVNDRPVIGGALRSAEVSSGSYLRVSQADAPSLDPSGGDYTIELWARPDAIGTFQVLLSGDRLGVDVTGTPNIGITADGRLEYEVNNQGFFTSAPIFEAGEWTHIAISHDSGAGETRLYLDGQLALIDTALPDIAGYSELLLGRRGLGSEFSGGIADVRIWDVARSGSDIDSNFYANVIPGEPGLIANWQFTDSGDAEDAVSGLVASDAGGVGRGAADVGENFGLVGFTDEDTTTVIALTVDDVDLAEGTNQAQVTLNVTKGALGVSDAGGATVSGNGSAALTLTGTIAELQDALGAITFTPDANETGNAILSTSISDLGNSGLGGTRTDNASFAIVINAVNDAPTAAAVAGTANEDGPGILIAADATDIDGDSLTFIVDDTGTQGSVTNNGDGTFTYDPAGAFEHLNGTASLASFDSDTDLLSGNPVEAFSLLAYSIVGAVRAPNVPITNYFATGTGFISNNPASAASLQIIRNGSEIAFALETGTGALSYLNVTTSGAVFDSDPASATYFFVTEPLESTAEAYDFISLESVDDPGLYLRHQGFQLKLASVSGASSSTQLRDSTFLALRESVDAAQLLALDAGPETATDTFTYTVDDGNGGTATETVTVTITGANDAPVAAAVARDVLEDGPIVQGTLAASASDVDANAVLTFALDAPVPGVQVGSDGTYVFTPYDPAYQSLAAGKVQTIVASYTVTDGQGASDTQTLTFTITGTNDAPILIAVTDTGAVNELPEGDPNEATNIATASGQFDLVDVDLLDSHTVAVAPQGAGYVGALSAQIASDTTGTGTGSVTWTFEVAETLLDPLAEGEVSTQTYAVMVDDGQGGTASQLVTITLTGSNDAPTIVGTSEAATEDGPALSIDLAALADDIDSDDDGTTLTFAVTGQPAEGSASVVGSNLIFDPGSDFQGLNFGETTNVTIAVQATDAQGATASSIFTVTVTGTNDAPTLALATANAIEDGPAIDVDLSVLGDDIDSEDDGTSLSYAVSGQPAEGSAAVSGSTLTFSPGADFQDLALGASRDVVIEITATDAQGASAVNTVTVTVTGTNDAPIAAAVLGNVLEDGPAVTVTADFTDVDAGDTHSFAVDDSATAGLVTNNGDGTFDYDPGRAFQFLAAGETATDSFAYTVTDAEGASSTEIVTITITGQNDAPVAAAVTGTVSEDGPAVTLAADFTDVDASDTHSFTIDDSATAGVVANNGDGTFSYDPGRAFQYLAVGETATDSFTYTVDDGQGGMSTETVTITITGENDAPEAQAVGGTASEDGPAIILSADFTDVDISDTHSFSIDTAGTTGAVINNGDGTFAYDPNGQFEHLGCDETATDTFSYTVDDGNGGTSTATISVTITGTNDLPVISGAVTATTDDNAAPIVLDLLSQASDAEGDALALRDVVLTSSDGRVIPLTALPDGTFTFDPTLFDDLNTGDSETVSVTYNVYEQDRKYEAVVGGTEALDNAGTFFIADDATGDLIRVKRSGSVNTFEQAIAVAGVSNGAAMLIDENSTGTGVSARLIQNGIVTTSPNAVIDLAGYTGASSVDPNNIPPNYTVFGDDFTNLDLTVEIPKPDADCGTLNYTFTLPAVTQISAQVTISLVALEVMPETVAATAEVTVDGANDAPVADDFSATVFESASDTVPYTYAAINKTSDVDSGDSVDQDTLFLSDLDVAGATITTTAGTFSVTAQELVDNNVFELVTHGAYTGNSGPTAIRVIPGALLDTMSIGDRIEVDVAYTVSDDEGATDTATATFIIIGTNDGPTISAASATAVEDGPLAIIDLSTLGDDVDGEDDGASLSYAVLTPPAEGSAVLSGTDLIFDPGADFQDLSLGETRDVTIEVQATDSRGASASNFVTITVTGTNDAPTLAAGFANATEDGATVNVDLAALGADVDSEDDGATLSYAVTGQPAEGSASVSGTTLTFDPGSDFQDLALGETRDVTIEVAATDTHGASTINTVTMTVTGTNDAPSVSGPVSLGSTDEDVAINFNVAQLLANASDIDTSDTLSVQNMVASSGVISGDATNGFTFTPAADDDSAVTLSYDVIDANGGITATTATLQVDAVADTPILTLESGGGGSSTGLIVEATDQTVPGTAAAGTERWASTAALSDGNFVVAYTSDLGIDRSYFQIIQPDGTPIGAPVQLTIGYGTSTPNNENRVSIESFPDGGFIAVWNNDDTTDPVMQRFDNSGTAVTSPSNQTQGSFAGVDILADGSYIVTSVIPNGAYLMTRFDGATNARLEYNVVLATPNGGTFHAADDLPSGGFVGAFETMGSGTGFDITVGIFNADGTPAQPLFQVPSAETFSQRVPSVATFDDDSFVVAYSTLNQDGSNYGIYLQRFAADGTPVGTETLVNQTTNSNQIHQTITALDDGGFVVTWNSLDGGPYNIFARRYDSDGNPVGDEVQVSQSANQTQFSEGAWSHEATTVLADGRILTTWDNTQAGTTEYAILSIDAGASGIEDMPVSIDLTAALADTDGSESLDLVLSGFPAGATFNLGTAQGSDWVIENAQTLDLTTLEMTPPLHWNGAFDLTVVATATESSNGDAATETVTATLTIEPVNDAPEAEALAAAIDSDGAAITFTADFTDPDVGDTHSYSVDTAGTQGSVTNNGDGTFGYDPNGAFDALDQGEVATDTFTYTVTDSAGASDTETVTVTITGVNDAPEAADLTVSALEDDPLSGTLATQVTDPDHDVPSEMTFSIDEITLNAPAFLERYLLNAGNSVPIELPEGAVRTIEYLGRTADGDAIIAMLNPGTTNAQLTNVATNSLSFFLPNTAKLVNVGPASSVPPTTFVADYTPVGAPGGNISTQVDNDNEFADYAGILSTVVLSYNSATGALSYGSWSLGTLTVDAATGAWAFDPEGDFDFLGLGDQGSLNVAFTATDDGGLSDSAVTTIQLTGTNDAPTAPATSRTVGEDSAAITLDANIADPDVGDDVSITLDTSGTQGVVTNNGDGTFSYDPSGAFEALAAGETATDSFTYTADDGNGGTASNTVTLTITGQNDAPVAVAIAGAVNENGPLADAFTSVIADSATVPNAGRFFVLNYTDQSFTEVARIPGTIDTAEQAAAAISVTDGAVLNLNGNNADWGAQFVLLSGGVGTEADPNLFDLQGYSGASSINTTYSAAIYSNSVSNALLTITVPSADTPDGPTSYSLTAEIVAFTDNSVGNIDVGAVTITSNPIASSDSVTVTANFTDVDAADTHTFTVDTTGTQGLVTNNGDGTFDYDTNFAFEALAAGETTTDSFTYTVGDGNGGTSTETATITITGQNDAPVAAALNTAINSDSGAIVLSPSFSDVDVNDTLTTSLDTSGTQGIITDNGDGTFGYDPNGAFDALGNGSVATDTFTYTVTDNAGATATETVTITVTGANAAPQANDDSFGVVNSEQVLADFGSTPVMTVLADGTPVVVTTSSSRLNVQLLNDDGSAQGAPTTLFISGASRPAVAGFDDGSFVVGYVASNNIYFQRFAADGSASGSGPVLAHPGSIQFNLSIAAQSDGSFMMSWEDFGGSADTSSSGVEGIRVAPDDTLGPVTLLNTTTNSTQRPTDTGLAALDGGGYAQVWHSSDGTEDTSGAGIRAVLINADGTLNGSDFLVNTVTNASQLSASVAPTAAGGFVVTWQSSDGEDTNQEGIRARVFDASGTALTGDVLINQDFADRQLFADVAEVPGGGFVFVWQEGNPVGGATSQIVARLFDANLNPISGDVVINENGNARQRVPSVEALPSGELIVTWEVRDDGTGDNDVYSRVIPADLDLVGEATAEDTSVVFSAADLLGNDVDANGDPLTITSVTDGALGTAVLSDNGTPGDGSDDFITYTPNADANGPDSFTYTISDGQGGSDTATVELMIGARNDAPVLAGSLSLAVTEDDGPAALNMLTGASDIDAGDVLNAQNVTGNVPGITFGATDIVVDPANAEFQSLGEGEVRDVVISYQISDGAGGVVPQTATISITGTNDPVTGIALSSDTVPENVPDMVVGDLTALDLDVSDDHTFTILPGADGALFEIVGNELRVGAAGLDFEASPTRDIHVRATDPEGSSFDATLTVNIVDSTEITLTSNADAITSFATNAQVLADATTLNAADSLEVSAGGGSLAIFGAGVFDLNTLAAFSGFDEVILSNQVSTDQSFLTLKDGDSLDVIAAGQGRSVIRVYDTSILSSFEGGDGIVNMDIQGTGAAGSVNLGNGDFQNVLLRDQGVASTLDFGIGNSQTVTLYDDAFAGAISFDAGDDHRVSIHDNAAVEDISFTSGTNVVDLYNSNVLGTFSQFKGGADFDNLFIRGIGEGYDLTSLDMTNVEALHFIDTGMTAFIDQQLIDQSGLQFVEGQVGAALRTSEASLDLSDISITDTVVQSSNATGTLFEVSSKAAAFQVRGGAGSEDMVQTDDFVFTSSERDTVFGAGSVEVISDTSGIYGDGSNNALTAKAAGSAMFGGAGADTLIDGAGNDTMTGGSEEDVFVFAFGGNDVVTDFSGGAGASDQLDLSAYGFADAAAALGAVTDDGLGNAEVALGGGATVTLTGISVAGLDEDDFIV